MKITEKIFDIKTGEETIIERDETPNEEASRLKIEKEIADNLAKQLEIENTKKALLTKLGLTEEEAKLLLS